MCCPRLDSSRYTRRSLREPRRPCNPPSPSVVWDHACVAVLLIARISCSAGGVNEPHLVGCRPCHRDTDFDDVYNCVAGGMATMTMMAVFQNVPLRQAPDLGPILARTRGAMEAGPGLPVLARSPHFTREPFFGRAFCGAAFFRAWLEKHPGTPVVAILDSSPISGEQILHYERHALSDRPAALDFSRLADRLPLPRLQDECHGESDCSSGLTEPSRL
jgi:hypothetical protein